MHLPAPQRDVRLRHMGAPTRMLSHNLLYLQLSPHLCLPSFVVFNFSVLSSSSLSLPFPTPGPFSVLALHCELIIHLGHSSLQHFFTFERWPPIHHCGPIPVPSLQVVDGSRITSLAPLPFSPSLLNVMTFDSQPWAPHSGRDAMRG